MQPHDVAISDIGSEETCEKLSWNWCAAALARDVKTTHVVLQLPPAALFHKQQAIRHANTMKLHGVGFFAKPVSAQSRSISLAEFMHASKP